MADVNKILEITNPTATMSPAEQLMNRIREAQQQNIQNQQSYKQGLQDQLAEIQSKKQKDLTPLFAVGDMIAGTNTAPVAQMIFNSPQQQQKEMLLQRMIGQAQGDISQSELNNLKQEYALMSNQQMEGVKQQNKLNYLDHQYDLMSDLQRLKNQGMANMGGGDPKNPFNKKRLEALGKTSVEYDTKDRPNMAANIEVIGQAIDTFDEAAAAKDKLFGTFGALAPDIANTMLGGDARRVEVRQKMEKAIQDTLRPTLGAQFTEAEGERIKKLTIDPKLSDAENRRRAVALKEYMEKKIAFSDALYAYIADKGNDQGFPYEKYGMRKTGVNQGALDASETSKQRSDKAAALKKKYGIEE